MSRSVLSVVAALLVSPWLTAQPYINGPLITHPGFAAGGLDASALEPQLNSFGAGAQLTATINNRLADDFVVPVGEQWTLSDISVFAYQTGSPITSTMTGGNYRIWSGQPGTPGATVLFDFSAANQLVTTSFTNIYRAALATLLDATRPIMRITMNGNGIVLNPGTYWLDWQGQGSLASGPFFPPISILGQTLSPTGNAVQFIGAIPAVAGNGWSSTFVSGAASQAQGFPFEINYAVAAVPFWNLSLSQTSAGAPLLISDSGGFPGNTFVNLFTFAAGNYPNGWLFGLDMSIGDLSLELSFGPPFVGTLDGSGNFSLPVPGIPTGITIYGVGLQLSGSGLVSADQPFAYTTI